MASDRLEQAEKVLAAAVALEEECRCREEELRTSKEWLRSAEKAL